MKLHLSAVAFAVAVMLGGINAASAEPFTFTAETTEEPTMSGVMTPEGMVGSANLGSKGTSTFASGDTESWTSNCLNFSSPQIQYDSQGYCNTTMDDTGDSLNVVHVCNNAGEEGVMDCWGFFAGGSGKYEKANGSLTWRTSPGGSAGGGNLNTE